VRDRLFSVYFARDDKECYVRLARVLEASARRHAPDWDVEVRRIQTTNLRSSGGCQSHSDNSWKLEVWKDEVCSSPEGTRIVLLDADTFLTGNPGDVWEQEFDVAYTARPAGVSLKYPINAGVFAVRVNDRSRAFMRAWHQQDRTFLADRKLHYPWAHIYGGMNQASLGSMLHRPETLPEMGLEGVKVAALECARFNCEDTSWELFHPDRTRIVHVKSALRMNALGLSGARTPALKNLVRLWRSVELGV
jgi:hypothetical protein